MSGHQHATIEDTVYFWLAANDTSGSGGDGATPLFDVREAGAAAGAIPLLSGTPTLLSHANFPPGCHEIAIAATVANGFAENDTFAVFCTLLIDSQNPTGFVGSCTLTPLAKSSEVANLTVAGSASKVPAKLSPNGFVITWGENEANNEDATRAFNGVTHDLEAQDDTGTQRIDGYYESVSIGAGVPSEVTWHGRLDKGGGATKNIVVQIQDVDLGTWRTVSGPGGIESSGSFETYTFDVFINEVGTGADLGKVRTRFLTGSVAFSATTTLHTDQIFTSFNAGSISNLDAVYFDSTAGNTGTTSNDGVPGNPVSSEAAVNTLLAARGLHKVEVAIGSSITFATTHTTEEWKGDNWTLGLGGQNLASSLFIGATVSGTHTGAARFEKCELGTISTAGMVTDNCGQDGTITITAPGTYIFNNNHSEISGANTPIVDMGALVGNVDLAIPDYHNGVELRNFNATGTDEFSISGIGQIIYAASCSGTVNQRGGWKVTNTGGVTITADDNTTKIDAIPTTAMRGTDGALTDKTGFSLSTAGILAIWHQLTSAIVTASTIGKLLVDNINATISSRATSAKQDTMETTLNAIPTTAMRGTDGANTTVPDAAGTAPTAVENRQEMDSNSTQLNTTLPGLIDDLAIKKNAIGVFHFEMVLTSDHVTPATGLTVTAQRLVDSGVYANVTGTITEISNGTYRFDNSAADSNGGIITWRFSAATADDTKVTFKPVA